MLSHAVSQQNGSAAQMISQHAVLLQPGPLPAAQQLLPDAGQVPPPPHRAPHIVAASPAQRLPNATLQQKVSAAHAVAWHAPSSPPRPPLPTQQLLPPPPHRAPHMLMASPAQMPSQATLQQNGSAAQTVAWQAASSQPR